MSAAGNIRIGIGGWTFEPWDETFYPPKLAKKRQLEHASRAVTAIEVNGTFYRSQTPATFAKWASETPDGFVFSLKAPRFSTNRKVLAEAGESIARFVASGIVELGDKLGPILWQFAATKQYDRKDLAAFLALLPEKAGERDLRHAVEVRHPSFVDPDFVDLARSHGVAIVCAEHETYPQIADPTADFVYLRLQAGRDEEPTCYAPAELDRWAERLQIFAAGGVPADLKALGDAAVNTPRDVFCFLIHGGKSRAPHGAKALLDRIG